MLEIGKVTSISDNNKNITVQFDRKTACANCQMCLSSADNMKVEINVLNTLNAKLDDTVEVGIGDRYVLTSALIIYIIPVILVAIALIATQKISEIYQIISIFAALAVGIIISCILDKKMGKSKDSIPQLIRIVDKTIDVHKEDK